jgi:tRNA threonylcarbamoyladenosine biosynthesis protein TsaE
VKKLMVSEIPLNNLRATNAFAREVARGLTGREVLLLSGDLGAGKTTFVRHLARALGIDPSWVSSPSFTLVQRYPHGHGLCGIFHADLYRLGGEGDLEALGLEEAWGAPDLIVVEWPALLERSGVPPGRPIHRLTFRVASDGSRTVRWERDGCGENPPPDGGGRGA